MALDANTLYQVLVSHVGTIDGVANQPIREGDILLGSKLPAGSEPLVIALGASPAEKLAGKRAAGDA